jgi:hypothetical protein
MFRALFHRRVRSHAQRIFASLFPEGYDGEVFLCGGAFKPLLKKGLPVHDYDLWVRTRKDREKLCAALEKSGAHLIRDFHPYCIKFKHDGQLVEITYHNVKDGGLKDVLNTFDLSLCSIGARYVNGKVVEAHVSDECWHAIRTRNVMVQQSYFLFLALQKAPSIVRTLHRMGHQAAELGFRVDLNHEHLLWDLYRTQFTDEERQAAIDLYFDTMVDYKGQHDERLVRRAMVGFAPAVPDLKSRGDHARGHMVPRVA